MTAQRILAEQQQREAIAAAAPLFVRACPGAGKTHVVVSRHLSSSPPRLRQGRALLSFTRAATRQMRQRCHREARPDATAFPHYLGTLDGFIWDMLVSPRLQADRPWQLLDSWSQLRAPIKLDREVELGTLPFSYDPATDTEGIRRDLLDSEAARTIDSSSAAWSRWEQRALAIRNDLFRQGYLTGHETRILALRSLRQDGERALGPLKSRFCEIIVDEAQDCSVTDLAILEHLHAAGLSLVVVADPDQMIYGWRDADIKRLESFAAMLGRTIELTGNRRSTPTICHLASTLRAGSRAPDMSVADHSDEAAVLLLPARFAKGRRPVHASTGRDLVDIFCEQASTLGIPANDCLITAQVRATLPGTTASDGGNATTKLARARQIVHSGTGDPDRVDHACRTAARILLRYWYPDATGSLEAMCATQDLPIRDLMRHAYAFLHNLPAPGSKTWPGEVNQRLKTWPRPPGANPRGSAGQLRGSMGKVPAIAADGPKPRIDNVHQVKGDEHDAVLLLLPDNDITTRWRSSMASVDETLRVWYVAVTRARKLVALAVPDNQVAALHAYLGEQKVPCRLY